jgi:hypothetical protein
MISTEISPQVRATQVDPQFSHIPSRNSLGEETRNATNHVISNLIDVTYSGGENLHALNEGGIISGFPHTSHIDTIVLTQMLRQWSKEDGSKEADDMLARLAFLAAADYWFPYSEPNILKKPMLLMRNFIAQTVIRMLPMERRVKGSKAERKKIIDENTEAIAHFIGMGGIAAVYPNGTRIAPNIPVADQDIKSGLGSIALMNPTKPIVPVHIRNSTHIWPTGSKIPNLNKEENQVQVVVGEPINISHHISVPEDLTVLSASDKGALRKIVNQILLDAYIDLELR